MKLKVVKNCYDQDGKRELKPGDIVENLSDFERGRHLAEGNVVPIVNGIERAVKTVTEKRRVRRNVKKIV